MQSGERVPQDERKPRPFIFTDRAGAKLLNQCKVIKSFPIMNANNTPANVATILAAAAYVRNETIINGNQAARLDAMIGQIKDIATKIEAVPAKIADLAAQGKQKAVAMWERMAARYKAQFAEAVASLRAWLVDFKANRPNVQIDLDEPEDHEPTSPNNNTPNVTNLARWIDLQLSTIIEGVSAGYTLGNYNSVWIDKGSTVFNVSLANGETVEIDSDKYNTAEEIANAILSALNGTTPPTKNRTTMKTTNTTPAANLLTIYLDNTREIYDRYTVPAIDKIAAMMRSNATHRQQFDATPAGVARLHEVRRALSVAAGLVRKYDHIAPTTADREQAAHDYAAYIVECAEYENANA